MKETGTRDKHVTTATLWERVVPSPSPCVLLQDVQNLFQEKRSCSDDYTGLLLGYFTGIIASRVIGTRTYALAKTSQECHPMCAEVLTHSSVAHRELDSPGFVRAAPRCWLMNQILKNQRVYTATIYLPRHQDTNFREWTTTHHCDRTTSQTQGRQPLS